MALRSYRRLFVPLLALPLVAQNASRDVDKPVPTIKTQVRRVLVDVVVTDAKDAPVTGLKQKDFEVLEDGKPQTVATFEEHKGAAPREIKLPPMPPNVYTNFPTTQVPDSVNVLLLDALNTPSNDQVYVREQMIKYLKGVPAGTRIAIFALAARLRMLQGFTTDSSELLVALNRGGGEAHSSALLQSEVEKDADQRRLDFMQENAAGPPANARATSGQPPASDPITAAQQFLADAAVQLTNARIDLTLEALEQLARYLAGIPGRKNVIWFSGSFPAGIVPNPDLPDPFVGLKNYEFEFRKATDLLATAQVALYPVAAEGLAADAMFPSVGTEIGQQRISVAAQDSAKRARTTAMDRDDDHATMENLAHDTGGKAFYNTNGLNDALARVVQNGSHFYTLAYSPANTTMDGKFRRIQVKLVDAKGTLAYRRGYYADDLASTLTAGPKQDVDPLLNLMGRNLPDYTQILYKLQLQPANPQPAPDAALAGSNTDLKKPIVRYVADFAISAEDLIFEKTPDGIRHGSVEVELVAYDREGKPLNFVVGKGEMAVTPDVYARLRKVGLQVHKEIDVPMEYVYLRTGVYDLKAGSAGTLGIPLQPAASQ